jgi:hypothetical protein
MPNSTILRGYSSTDSKFEPVYTNGSNALLVSGVGVGTPALQPNGTQADQSLTVDATAGGVQFAAFHADTTQVFWSCEAAQCRVTFDGSAPTTTNGHLIGIGDSGIWSKALATAAKFIRTGATSAVISASQLKG